MHFLEFTNFYDLVFLFSFWVSSIVQGVRARLVDKDFMPKVNQPNFSFIIPSMLKKYKAKSAALLVLLVHLQIINECEYGNIDFAFDVF